MKTPLNYCLIFLLLLPAAVVHAQSLQIIKADFNTAALQAYVPFDVPFIITGKVTNDVVTATLKVTVFKTDTLIVQHAREYSGRLFVPTVKDSLTKIEFMVDPVPPDRKIKFEFVLKKSLATLPAFIAKVRKRIHEFNKGFLTGASFTNSDFTALQGGLRALFRAEFSAYRANFRGTILDSVAGNWAAEFAKYQSLCDHVRRAHSNVSTILGRRLAISNDLRAVKNYRRLRRLYESAFGSPVSNTIFQVLPLQDFDIIAINYGETFFDPTVMATIPSITDIAYTVEMDPVVADKAAANIEKSMRALDAFRSFILANVIGKKKVITALNDGTLPAGAQADVETELVVIADHLARVVDQLNTQKNQIEELARNIRLYNTTFDALMGEFSFSFENRNNLAASSSNTFDTRGSWYISADVGFLYAPQIHDLQPVYGAIIYFSPVNKQCSYSFRAIRKIYGTSLSVGEVRRIWIKKHVGVALGVTLHSIKDDSKRIDNLWGESSNLAVGLGVRLGSAFRITGGAFLFRSYKDGDLLTTERQVRATPYISATLDINLLKFFGKIGTTLFP